MTTVRDTSIKTYHEIKAERRIAKHEDMVLRLISKRPGLTDREMAEKKGCSEKGDA